MNSQNLSAAKTLNPSISTFQSSSLSKFSNPLRTTLTPFLLCPQNHRPLSIKCRNPNPQFSRENPAARRDVRSFAGRSKSKPGAGSSGRIEGNAEPRREARRNARRKSKKFAESLFYRLKNPHRNYPDNFSQDELQMMGLGYDRLVRFMEKDDPNLKHPYDWYKYGEFGPYSWRGVVLGEPIRGRFSDECVTMIGEVRDQEEWEKIEQFEMAQDFQKRLDRMDKNVGFRYFWVFVSRPNWRASELPWEQWTLVSEVALEAGDQRLDKWNLMERLGNGSRACITQCAAWMRPDLIYVKTPLYQCRFEPQDDFFRAMAPLLDPASENDILFELEDDDGRVELCTYFGGLCKILRVNPKAFVDDVVKAFEKASEDTKSKCLGFLLCNHPVPLLHPYTKEWKAKLEEMEFGCDAPDDDDDDRRKDESETEIVDWIEDDQDGDGDDSNLEDDDDVVFEAEASGDDELDLEEDDDSPEEDPNYWDEEFKKAMSSNEAMEKLLKRSMEVSDKYYDKQMRAMEEKRRMETAGDGDELEMWGARAKVSREERQNIVGRGPWRKVRRSKIPPGLFLRSAVRPFTYKNLVKEIVLTRHAIVEGEIGSGK